VAAVVQHGLKRMLEEQQDEFYYITLMNENYTHPAMPEGVRDGIVKGMYLFKASEQAKAKARVQLLGSGTILREVIAASALLEEDWGIAADVWSCPSFVELRREGLSCERWNLLHPTESRKVSYVESCLTSREGPVVAASDYMKALPDGIRAFIPKRYSVLGTDGFGRSDSRENLRRFFEVNRYYVAIAALKALADDGVIAADVVTQAIAKYGIDPDKPEPVTV
jgi:pyruvate dehydrogenase E1 component